MCCRGLDGSRKGARLVCCAPFREGEKAAPVEADGVLGLFGGGEGAGLIVGLIVGADGSWQADRDGQRFRHRRPHFSKAECPFSHHEWISIIIERHTAAPPKWIGVNHSGKPYEREHPSQKNGSLPTGR